MTIQEFMNKYFIIKKELYIEDQYIPSICDKLYPRANKGMSRREFIKEIYYYIDMYRDINFPLSQIAEIKRKELGF